MGDSKYETLTQGNSRRFRGEAKESWYRGQQEIKFKGDIGVGLDSLAGEIEIYVQTSQSSGDVCKLHIERTQQKQQSRWWGRKICGHLSNSLFFSLTLTCLFLLPLSFKDI